MTREDAEQIDYHDDFATALKKINDYEERQKPEPCEDAVSREELLKAIETWDKFGCDADTKLVRYQDHYVPYIHYDDVIKCIKGMPSVTQKSGKWIENRCDMYICSQCQHTYTDLSGERLDMNFCPNCGAKMVEPQESEDKE